VALSRGSKIGSFEIIDLLGIGGMGEVYRAKDSKLNRDVALKVLPESLTHDVQRVARFRREAQVLASINHPNIGGIHGLEDASGVTALVLELVEGPTLADRIARGPLPVAEALPIAAQIASALEAAHEQGIIHRDLKPANIKLRPDGTVKVLDFGLAKAIERADAPGNLTQSPTMVSPATQAGILLGTAAYMSPEQARGQAVDRRADIWAFGCVLFEMLTATPVFAGDHVSDVLAKVLRDTPDWQKLPPDARPLLPVLQRCLEKDFRLRLRDAGDVQLLIADRPAPASGLPVETTARSAGGWKLASGVVFGIAAGAAATILFQQQSKPQSVQTPPRRFELKTLQSDLLATESEGTNVAISPDGSRLVYTSTRRGVPYLVMRDLAELAGKPIAGSEGGFDPFFSPDGQQIGFATFTELKRVGIGGGPTSTICPIDAYYSGASWGDNNTIVFAEGSLGLFRVQASGGSPERLTLPDAAKGERGFVRPVVLPASESILYGVVLTDGSTRIAARRIGSSDSVTLVEGGFGPKYLSRRLVFGQGDRVMAIDFDAASLRVVGSPALIASGVYNRATDTNVAGASDGTLAYVSGHYTPPLNRLAWVDHSGRHSATSIGTELEYPRNVRLSPDGRRVALTVGPGGQGQIWVYDLTGGAQPTKLTFQDHNLFPIWSPDGKRIAFVTRASSANRMLLLPADGSTVQPAALTTTDFFGAPSAWSPDGAFILFIKQQPPKAWALTLANHEMHQWLQTPFSEWGGSFSPDGRWVTFASDQTGTSEVWVRPFPGAGAPIRVSAEGGQKPFWSKDGREIFYENGARLMSAGVRFHGSDFRAEPPRQLFEGGFMRDDSDPNVRYLDSAPDGRLLIVEANQTPSDASIVVAQHWDDELTRK
jgi:eukaryotic-like serine/threonine-protein kinase